MNRQEQVAILFLAGALLVGTGAAVVDHYRPDHLEDFHVVRGAPPAAEAADGPPSAAGDGRPSAAAAPESGAVEPVSLNRASAAQLESLPLIGPATAAAIVAYRQAHGPFADVGQLTAVKGIGPRTVERLRPLVSAD